EELSEEDRQIVSRARRIERFLSQPFIVAEPFTGKPGNVTPLAETIRSFEELCDGKWDHLPEGAFMYVGAIEEAAEQAKKMAGGKYPRGQAPMATEPTTHTPSGGAPSNLPLQVVVVTPEKAILDERADMVILPMIDGELGVLRGRAALVGRLGRGELRLKR